jgi:hypothetical protein
MFFGSPKSLYVGYMDQATRLKVYKAQTKNVKEISKARKQIERVINHALRRDDMLTAQVQTKALALVFCAWAEANFSKTIHTPYGFTLDEISQIKQAHKNNGLEKGWEKCIELGLKRILNHNRSNYIPNTKQKLKKLVQECVVEPSLIRNKIAHGQWDIALNRNNTEINSELSMQIQALDVVVVYRWFESHKYLANIIEALIESPNRTFHHDYWIHITELRNFLDKTRDWNMEDKIKELKRKPILKRVSP